MSDPSPQSPEPGAYTDEELPGGEPTRRMNDTAGAYDDVERADGVRDLGSTESAGAYTDVDEDGDRDVI